MGRGQNETSWLKHQALGEIQSTEVFLSGFNALCTFSHLLHGNTVKTEQLTSFSEKLIFWKTVTTFDFDDIYILKEHTLTYLF
jgi:hypothetical protein